jgi:hypothetical protein
MEAHKVSFNDITNKFGFKTASDRKSEQRIKILSETQQIKSPKQIERELVMQI